MPKLRLISPGEKFSCWTVGKLLPKRTYECKCDCGNTQKVRASDLINGNSKMCRSCSISVSKRGHGYSSGENRSQEYISWQHMNQRCSNPESKDWDNYGGRGITVCKLWQDSFEAFLMDMGHAPGPGWTIDRIESNGNYIKSNCKWSTKTEQSRNRRNNHIIEIDGVSKVLSEWIEHFGFDSTTSNTIYKRISRLQDPKEALLKSLVKDILDEES